MFWNIAVGGIAGYFEGQATNALVEANNKVRKANAEASNRVRDASNLNEAAQNTLARWVQSVNNNRRLDAGGDAIEQNIVNARREDDATLTRSFSASIQDAEQQGAAAAQQAASGIEGGAVDMVNTSIALRSSIVDQQLAEVRDTHNYDVARRAGSIMMQTVGGLDNSLIYDRIDYNKDVAIQDPTFSRFVYALKGAASGLGAGGGVDSGQAAAKQSAAPKYTASAGEGLAMRERSSSNYDLADQAFDTKKKFGWEESSTQEYSPYSIGSDKVTFGEKPSSYWSN